jgi:cyclopropane-fatty-acyl-phospholipid synthase
MSTPVVAQSRRFVSLAHRVLQSQFERVFLRRWRGRGVRVRFWDSREVTVGELPAVATVEIREPSVLWAMLRSPSLGFGRAYADGRLEVVGDLEAFLEAAHVALGPSNGKPPGLAARWFRTLVAPRTSSAQAEANARFHYDTGNEFFRLWLDPGMSYSCAYFRSEDDDLATAQTQKLELICRKLDLAPGQTLLDIGCGWGALLFHAIERYGVRGVGVTPSRQQAEHVQAEASRRGLADRFALEVCDWRRVRGPFDRVVSVGMYEHVGQRHGREFFRRWRDLLKPDGVSLLHTIGAMGEETPDPWTLQYIFPGGYIPALYELAGHAAATGLMIADVENLWRHYALTLRAWARGFAAARQTILQRTDERFVRTWWLWLNGAEAAFRAGRLQLWQLLLTPGKGPRQPLSRAAWVA